MIRIRKKKKSCESCEAEAPRKAEPRPEPDASFVGAFPGKPWERLTNIRHGKGSRLKVLNSDEQAAVVDIARRYFKFDDEGFARARSIIQNAFDRPNDDPCAAFFARANVLEKRLAVRAYLSDADGRFIEHDAALELLRHVAAAALDFEVGAIDHYPDKQCKTEIVVGDGTEVISDQGYWFAHTHPARAKMTNNVLPSTQDLDVMLATACSYAHNLEEMETAYYVMRDIGMSRVTITCAVEKRPSSASIERVAIAYYFEGGEDESVEAYAHALMSHLRMRYGMKQEQISVERRAEPL